jgi:hypothetical protein
MNLILAALMLLRGALLPNVELTCSIVRLDGSTWQSDTLETRKMVAAAVLVVRVRATGPDSAPVVLSGQRFPGVGFDVLEVLRSDSLDATPHHLAVTGRLTDYDDFNRTPVPYPYVRPDGLRGSCFADTYRVGAEYLLLMARARGALTPYWAPLLPTNEQLHGPGDPWLVWVRARLREKGRE